MAKHAIIQESQFNSLTGIPEAWNESDFQDIQVNGIDYKRIYSFDHYFTPELTAQFDQVFDNYEEMQQWIFTNSTTEKTIEL